MKELWELYVSFFKVGLLTFGGGMAMLPMLQSEIVNKKQWTTEEELLNYFAVGQCTPGIIAVNTATFVGHKRGKAVGAAAATLGVISPSIIIILLIAAFFGNISTLPMVQNALWGVRIAASALILNSIIKLWKAGVKNLFGICMFLFAFLTVGVFGITSVVVVIAAILIGNIFGIIRERRNLSPKQKGDR